MGGGFLGVQGFCVCVFCFFSGLRGSLYHGLGFRVPSFVGSEFSFVF